jgi:hypothetical protein
LKFSELVRESFRNWPLAILQEDGEALCRLPFAGTVQDLAHQGGVTGLAVRFDTKINVVFVGLIEELMRGNRAAYSRRHGLEPGIEQQAKASAFLLCNWRKLTLNDADYIGGRSQNALSGGDGVDTLPHLQSI